MPIKIYGHDFRFVNIDGAACRFGLKDATGGVRTIFDGGPTRVQMYRVFKLERESTHTLVASSLRASLS